MVSFFGKRLHFCFYIYLFISMCVGIYVPQCTCVCVCVWGAGSKDSFLELLLSFYPVSPRDQAQGGTLDDAHLLSHPAGI